MKKIILLIIVSCTVVMATAQQTERFTFATSVGTGIDMILWYCVYFAQTSIKREVFLPVSDDS